jgi:xylulose-5-phosphate/fructose-6-phosphate phosphoketolase
VLRGNELVHGLEETRFVELFTAAKPVVFAFHGYQRAVHAILHGRTKPERFHVRGFIDEGTTTTPFDRVVRNKMSRFHLCIEALRRSDYAQAGPLMQWCETMLSKHQTYGSYDGSSTACSKRCRPSCRANLEFYAIGLDSGE